MFFGFFPQCGLLVRRRLSKLARALKMIEYRYEHSNPHGETGAAKGTLNNIHVYQAHTKLAKKHL